MNIRVKITRDRSGRAVTMDLEDYLKGVVPSEIKAESCPMEAQKAASSLMRSTPTATAGAASPRWSAGAVLSPT